MRLRTWTATLTSVTRRSSIRARSPSPITCFHRPIASSIVRTQSPKWFAFTVRAGRDDIADLDAAVGDDQPGNQQFEQRPLSVKIGSSQTVTHTLTERFGMSGQTSRLILTLGVLH